MIEKGEERSRKTGNTVPVPGFRANKKGGEVFSPPWKLLHGCEIADCRFKIQDSTF
jgi:hypothetical protein